MNEPTDRPRRRRYSRWVIEAAIVLALFLAIRAWQQRGTADGPAPALVAPALDGSTVSLAEMRGAPVLVHFWASWCGVCRAMEGNVAGVADDHRVVAVASSSGDLDQVRAWMREHDLDLPVVVDEDGRLARAWGVSAFPTSYVVDGGGKIASTEVGYTTELGLRARLWLAR